MTGTGEREDPPEADTSDRILTIPNLLSLIRLCCIPVFVWLLFGRDNRVGAALLLGGLGATDWVDGYIARRYDQVSTLGKILDPVADRLLLVVAVVCIMIDGSVPLLVAWLVIARELAVSLAVVSLAALGATRIDVTFAGKCGTFLLMTAFPLFLAGNADDFAPADAFELAAWGCAIVGLGFSYYAAYKYIPLGRAALREGRSGRRGTAGRVGSGG